MAEKLTVSLEDGDVDKLRELAGGPRKIGTYLHSVVNWLWYHREQLQTQPLQSFAPVLQEWIPRVTMSPEEQRKATEANDAMLAQIRELEQRYAELGARIDSWIDARDAAVAMLETRYSETADVQLVTGAGVTQPE